MKLVCMWRILILDLWMHIVFMPGLQCHDGIVSYLSNEDVLLLKDVENPKCFTRTEDNFTCFFQTTDNKTYDIFYQHGTESMKRCEMSVQTTKEGDFLHICQFPSSDVYTYSKIRIQVVEHNSNIITCSRTTLVESNFLLDPPSNVFLNPNGNVGQLLVSWHTELMKYWEEQKIYRIRYSSNSTGEKTIQFQVKMASHNLSLSPGKEIEVQVSFKVGEDDPDPTGHWSSWSKPARAYVPQSADDISLTCYTSDLHEVVCQWNGKTFALGNTYKLFYQTEFSNWTECQPDEKVTDQCYFYGNESRHIKVQLSSPSAPLSRTFYSQSFMLNKIFKPFPPHHLKGEYTQDGLCMEWKAPLSSLQNDLQYEVEIQIKGDKKWTRIIGSETVICEQIPLGNHFSAKIRAKPNGFNYSGSWSDWSDVLTGKTPPSAMWVIYLIAPVATFFICTFAIYHSKLQQYLWPQVPNLDNVLQGFLTEKNTQKWNSPVTAKQYLEETTSSVEIISEYEVSELEKLSEESSELLSLDGSFSSGELTTSPGTEFVPDYVTLNKEIVIFCLEGNSYVCELTGEKRDPRVGEECLQICNCSCIESSSCVTPYSDFTNHCYLIMSESTDRYSCMIHGEKGPGNLYTNLPCS